VIFWHCSASLAQRERGKVDTASSLSPGRRRARVPPAKSEIGFCHYEGRNYKGLMRHMTLCQLVLLFAAEPTDRLRGEKPGGDGADRRADGAGAQHTVPHVA
jgi:hypothetical protein